MTELTRLMFRDKAEPKSPPENMIESKVRNFFVVMKIKLS